MSLPLFANGDKATFKTEEPTLEIYNNQVVEIQYFDTDLDMYVCLGSDGFTFEAHEDELTVFYGR